MSPLAASLTPAARRRGGGGGGGTPTFWTVTSVLTPNGSLPRTPAAAHAASWTLVPFNAKTGLDAAIASIAGGQYIYYSGPGALPTSADFSAGIFYNGSGVLTISSSTGTGGNVYTVSKNPASTVIIDFGTESTTATANWGSPTTTNYVKFAYTGTSNVDCFYVHDSANITFYGGEFTTGQYGGSSIRWRGNFTSCQHWDYYSSMSGTHGFQFSPASPVDGSAATANNCHFRGESTRFCMNPARDPHLDKGSGLHGVLWQDTSHGSVTNCSIILYAHNSLQQGETSAGVLWPSGGGGSGLEMGTVGDSTSNCTFWVLTENCHFKPNGGNPGSSGSQTGTNGFNMWGSKPLNSYVIEWAEGKDITGSVTHGSGGAWFPGSPAIHVKHGRHTNVNQYTGGSNYSVPYDTTHGINYDPDVL